MAEAAQRPAQPLRAVHYLNQFFAGMGGESAAGVPLSTREGAVGPGRALQAQLRDRATIVATLVAGDNYAAERGAEALAAAAQALRELRPDVLVAGPAFAAGRYGVACGAVCAMATRDLGIPSVTAMHPDNPGVLLHRRETYIVPAGPDAGDMAAVLPRLARLALRLGAGEPLGPAAEEGYLPRGHRRNVQRDTPGFERALDMLLARVRGEPWTSEVLAQSYEVVAPAPPVADLAHARLGLVTSGGLVPKGNPDRLVSGNAAAWFRYSIAGLDALGTEDWESVHGGFSTVYLNTRNPAYVLPLPAIRRQEAAGAVGEVYPSYCVTVGNGTSVANAKRMGAEIARELKEAGVDAVLQTAT
jgi:glycine reductase complex component B subunit gamma